MATLSIGRVRRASEVVLLWAPEEAPRDGGKGEVKGEARMSA